MRARRLDDRFDDLATRQADYDFNTAGEYEGAQLAALLDAVTVPQCVVSNGPVSMGQLCCDPGFRQLDAVINYRRWELDESAIRPDYLAALRLLEAV